VVVRRGQIQRIRWVIKILEAQIGQRLLVESAQRAGSLSCKNKTTCSNLYGVFPSKCPAIAPAEIRNTSRW
jgi:hypothetical protein